MNLKIQSSTNSIFWLIRPFRIPIELSNVEILLNSPLSLENGGWVRMEINSVVLEGGGFERQKKSKVMGLFGIFG